MSDQISIQVQVRVLVLVHTMDPSPRMWTTAIFMQAPRAWPGDVRRSAPARPFSSPLRKEIQRLDKRSNEACVPLEIQASFSHMPIDALGRHFFKRHGLCIYPIRSSRDDLPTFTVRLLYPARSPAYPLRGVMALPLAFFSAGTARAGAVRLIVDREASDISRDSVYEYTGMFQREITVAPWNVPVLKSRCDLRHLTQTGQNPNSTNHRGPDQSLSPRADSLCLLSLLSLLGLVLFCLCAGYWRRL